MKAHHVVALSTLLLTVLTTGCESTRSARIRENHAVYDSLQPFAKQLVNDGLFDFGFSADMVYMSMGKPNRVETKETEGGTVETWVYKNFLYGSAGNITFAPRESSNSRVARPGPSNRNPPLTLPTATAGPPAPTIAEMSDPPMATLLLELRDGRVVGARLQF